MARFKSFLASAFAVAASMIGADSASAVLVLYEPFADSNSSLAGNTPGTGFSGTWAATASRFNVATGSLVYGSLPTSGNRVVYAPSGGAASRIALNSDLTNAGLLNNGATLFFSVLITTPPNGGSNPDTGFAIGTGQLSSDNNMQMPVGGEGIGWTIKNDRLKATTWDNTPARPSGTSGGRVVATSTTMLVVGELIWGLADGDMDVIRLYLPNTSLVQGAVVHSNQAVLNQTLFTGITTSMKSDGGGYSFDEIRFGSTYNDVIGITAAAAVPEPATASLALIGLAGVMMRRRRMA